MANHGLHQLIKEPTRITYDSCTLIDHIFIRHNCNCKIDPISWVVDSQVTDHHMTVVFIKYERIDAHYKEVEQSYNLDYQLLKKNAM